jgi:hypothetical protein
LRRRYAIALIPALLGAGGASAADIAQGNFMGSGRACYGMLTITSRAITWETPYSQCRTSPYSIRDRRDGAEGLRITYQLASPSANCRYSVLVLTHNASENPDIGWNVTGYASLDGATQDRRDAALSCYLYRA